MQVFKACLKIIKRNLPSMMIYLSVFLVFVILVTLWNPQSETEDFTTSRPRMTIINDDTGHPLSEGLKNYLYTYAQSVELDGSGDQILDALFFRQIVYVLRIPNGFGNALANGDTHPKLIRTTLPDSYQGAYSDQLINRYLTTTARFLNASPDMELSTVVRQVNQVLEQSADVSLRSEATGNGFSSMIYFYIFLAYSLTAVMILGVSSLMLAFQNKDIRRRNFSSPVQITQYNFQLILGNLIFAVVTCLILCLVSLFFYRRFADFPRWLLLVLNTFVFIITIMGLSFLLSQFIRSRGMQQAVANVVSLGTCFISGVFVPQELLGENVLAVASFTPTYWYINAIRLIQHTESVSRSFMNRYAVSLLIQLSFAVAFLVVALVVSKQKRQSEKQ